nr:MAG TPA: hypothetical protein [Caudoviricetes sp.]
MPLFLPQILTFVIKRLAHKITFSYIHSINNAYPAAVVQKQVLTAGKTAPNFARRRQHDDRGKDFTGIWHMCRSGLDGSGALTRCLHSR